MRVTLAFASGVAATGVSPIQKVLEMLQDMMAKGKAEMQAEQVEFAKAKQFCDNISGQKKASIADSDEKIEALSAETGKLSSDMNDLNDEIKHLDENADAAEMDLDQAKKLRKQEHAAYIEQHKEYVESLDALERAIAVLKKKNFAMAQGALIQVAEFAPVPQQARAALTAFVSMLGKDGADTDAADSTANDFQSGGIIEMLKGLKDKFRGQLRDLEKEELNSKHSFEMISADANDKVARAKSQREGKAGLTQKKAGRLAVAKGELQDEEEDKAADEKYLSDLEADCTTKSNEYEQTQQLRAEELEALETAHEILSSGDVAGAGEKHLKLVQIGSSLAQLRSATNPKKPAMALVQSPARREAAALLSSRAKKLGSKELAELALTVEADPFVKVKKMIKDMIRRLLESANEEAEHKGWCDQEMGTNKQTRDSKTDAVDTLESDIEGLESSITKLNQDVVDLQAGILNAAQAIQKATKDRTSEKEKNEETIRDAKGAQVALTQALSVLRDFYKKAGSFVQAGSSSKEPYTGMGGQSGGVLGMLEVIQSDFARLETDTKAEEAAAEREYDQFVSDTNTDKAVKERDLHHKEHKIQSQEADLVSHKQELKSTQEELDAALRYYEKLKPSCVDSGSSHEERMAKRQEEIESLKEALRILNGDDIA